MRFFKEVAKIKIPERIFLPFTGIMHETGKWMPFPVLEQAESLKIGQIPL
jgi:hypothetical protein